MENLTNRDPNFMWIITESPMSITITGYKERTLFNRFKVWISNIFIVGEFKWKPIRK